MPSDRMADDERRHTVTISAEAWSMIERAKEQLMHHGGRTPTRRDALDWLLRDMCEYGSPIVGSWARQTWPGSAETNEWNRKVNTGRYRPAPERTISLACVNCGKPMSEHDTLAHCGVQG